MDSELIEIIITIIIFVVVPVLRRMFGRKEEEPESLDWPEDDEDGEWAELPEPDAEPPPYPGPPPRPAPAPVVVASEAAARDPDQEARALLSARVRAAATHAAQLGEDIRVSRATARFADALDGSVAARARALADRLDATRGPVPVELFHDLRELSIVLGQLEVFVGQRKNPALLADVGDADTLAVQCYEPVMQFAHAEGIGLRSHTPVTQLGDYDLATWTAFIPTGFAPIFLPRRFFDRVAWWPAVAHEIAHDFLFAADGVQDGMRAQLGLASEDAGTQPLVFSGDGLSMAELRRLFGGWFEEMFADVFGTLMMGPAYGWASLELFAAPHNPAEAIAVGIDASGRRYGVHPPRQLRLAIITRVLELAGQEDDARELREAWDALHGGPPDRILFPIGGQLVGVPIEPLEGIAVELATRLYSEQFQILAGHRLPDIPGVDFGPGQNAECERAAASLLAGAVPNSRDARAVIAGAVLAARRAPDREAELLRLAREAIPARGSLEARPDAYRVASAAASPPAADASALREAMLLDIVLSPSPAMRRVGLGPRRHRFMARP